MKALFALVLGVTVLAQQPTEPYPGHDNHAEPPKGWFCSPDAAQPEHRCACSGMPSKPECGTPDQPPPNESAKCTVWCHPEHCSCFVLCEDSQNMRMRMPADDTVLSRVEDQIASVLSYHHECQ